MTQTPAKVPPLEQVRFCQIQCVRDTPQNRRTKKIITLNLKENGNDPVRLVHVHVFMVPDADQHHLLCEPQQPGKPTRNGTPSTRHVTERKYLRPRHSDAKQLDVYDTSQPLPSSLTEVYSDLHHLGRG